MSRTICEEYPEIGKNIHRIVYYATHLKFEDVAALIRLMEKAPFVNELILIDMDIHFFQDALRTLLSAMNRLSTLTMKGCSINSQALDTINKSK